MHDCDNRPHCTETLSLLGVLDDDENEAVRQLASMTVVELDVFEDQLDMLIELVREQVGLKSKRARESR